jgi:calcium/calmodulin-dependent protein kinase I
MVESKSKEEVIGGEETDKQIKLDYKIESVIGKGSFATVRKGKNRETKERVAIKILSKRKMTDADVDAIGKEIAIMKEVDHPNIVKMVSHYEDKGHYCLVMELMQGGELFDHIIEKETFDEETA